MRSASSPDCRDIGTNGLDFGNGGEGNTQVGGPGAYRHPLYPSDSGPWDVASPHQTRHPHNRESHEITLGHDATPVSFVEDMLSSLNTLPDAQGPFPEQTPVQSSFLPGGSLAPNFLQRAFTGHRRAKSSVATTASSSTVGAPPQPQDAPSQKLPRILSHTRNTTVTQANFDRKGSAPSAMSADSPRRGILHKAKPSFSEKMAKQLSDPDARKGSSAGPGFSGPSSRNGSPARGAEAEARDSNRRRSRSFNVSGSVLNRSRPVPAEYHNFEGAAYGSASRPGLRKSLSNPNHQIRLHEEVPPDMPTDRSFPPNALLGNYDHSDRGSSRAPSSTYMGVDSVNSGLPSREASGIPFGSSYASSVGSRNPAETRPPPKSPGKERPGFFKRMFGPSRSNINPEYRNAPQLPPLHVDTKRDAMAAQGQQGPQTAPLAQPPPIQSAASEQSPVDFEEPQKMPPQTLKQKSSFFRRRRKTVNEKDGCVTPSREESPSVKNSRRPSTSSLRQAMDPYMVHDPMPDDMDLEHLDNLRRKQPQQQDLYEFLRTTSPTTAHAKSVKPRAGAPPASNDAPGANAANFDDPRPSTSAPHPRPRDDSLTSRSQGDQNGATDGAQAGRVFLPAAGPAPAGTSDADQASSDVAPAQKAGATPRQPKKAPPPPPLDVSASKRDNTKTRWQSSSTQSRSNSEKGSSRVPLASDEQVPFEPPKRPENVRAVASDHSVGTEDYISAKSVPTVQPDEQEDDVVSPLPTNENLGTLTPWTARDFERAQRIWEAQSDPAVRGQGALELGEPGEAGDRLRVAFMSFFDFSGLNILLALRDLCGRMTLKGETQQMDRIMAAFSERWCECNPFHGFKSEDVVHTICYSLLLLNTDLHIANLSEKMTQRQFVKNTVPTLRRIAEVENIDPEATLRASRTQARPTVPWQEGRSSSPMGSPELGATFDRESSSTHLAPAPVASMRRPISGVPSMASPSPYDNHPVDAAELFVNAPHDGNMKSWEAAVETILKEFYTSVRQLRLPLHGAPEAPLHEQSSSNSLSVVSSIMRRTGSVISKTPSENSRGRVPEFRSTGSRWSSKNRSKQRMYPSSTLGSSRTGSRTSLDDSSPWSPTASSTWSKSYGHTQTTMSTDSLASRFAPGADPGYQQSIGFANALSHAIIREEGSILDEAPADGDASLLEDQTLELAGAPWAKEGILQHKHHLETVDKKAKDRNWSECFAVVEKGVFRLFSFNKPKSSLRSPKTPKGAVVGGGNWLDNANPVGTFMLRQTIANALPPPGYSKSRPFVFALSLPTGAVHLFQVGTPEIAREFVSTANYWSARLSKEPLVGGVSSIEYGWGESVINTALVTATSDSSIRQRSTSRSRSNTGNAPPSSFNMTRTSSSLSAQGGTGARSRHSPSPSISMTPSTSSRPSLHESLRSSLDAASRPMRSRLPADRIALGEWTPPQQSLMASPLSEQAQLEALTKYVRSVEDDLGRHNELRAAMALAFSARSTNAQRALGNWERKSSYLLREIVKFRTYVDVLQFAAAEAKRVKSEEGADDASTTAGAPEKKVESTRGRIRKVGSSGSFGSQLDDLGLPEETLEALRMARAKQGKNRRSVSG